MVINFVVTVDAIVVAFVVIAILVVIAVLVVIAAVVTARGSLDRGVCLSDFVDVTVGMALVRRGRAASDM